MVTKKKQGYLYLDKIDFAHIKKRQRSHYIIVMGPIHQKDITILNIYVSNIRAPNHKKQKLTELKEEINSKYNNRGEL